MEKFKQELEIRLALFEKNIESKVFYALETFEKKYYSSYK